MDMFILTGMGGGPRSVNRRPHAGNSAVRRKRVVSEIQVLDLEQCEFMA